MRADGAGLFDHAHADAGIELFQANGKGQAGRAGTHGDHVVFHDIPFNGRVCDIGHQGLRGWLVAAVIFSVCSGRGKSASMRP